MLATGSRPTEVDGHQINKQISISLYKKINIIQRRDETDVLKVE